MTLATIHRAQPYNSSTAVFLYIYESSSSSSAYLTETDHEQNTVIDHTTMGMQTVTSHPSLSRTAGRAGGVVTEVIGTFLGLFSESPRQTRMAGLTRYTSNQKKQRGVTQ